MFSLVGFVSPGRARPTFLIPYFSCADSNKSFAQELDANYRIVTLLNFHPENYIYVPNLPPPMQVEAGEEGVLAILNTDGSVECGRASDIRNLLAAQPLDDANAPFFAVEALSLVGDRRRLNQAILVAGRSFTNKKAGTRWRARARKITDLIAAGSLLPKASSKKADRLKPVDPLEEILSHLRLSPDREDWAATWHAAVANHGLDERLRDLAVWWLSSTRKRGSDWIEILVQLLRQAHSVRALRAIAMDWLSSDSMGHPQWPQVWLDVSRYVALGSEHIRLGFEFLYRFDDRFDFGQREIGSWVSIWTRLVREQGPSDALIEAAHRVSSAAFPHPAFVGRVLTRIHRWNRYNFPWVSEQLLQWLRTDEGYNAVWPDAFLALFQDRADYHPELVELGLRWLKNGNPNLKKWPLVWNAVGTVIEPDLHRELAVGWLMRASFEQRAFPDVLAEAISRYRIEYPEVRERAEHWLRLGLVHPQRSLIVDFVASGRGDAYLGELPLGDPPPRDPETITELSLKGLLDRRLGSDARISSYTYRWITKIVRTLGFTKLSQVDEAIDPYNDDQLSYLLVNSRLGQVGRFEFVLLAGFRERFIRIHPWSNLDWFVRQQQKLLETLDANGIAPLRPGFFKSLEAAR